MAAATRRKRAASEEAVEAVRYEGTQPTPFLNTRTYERLDAPLFENVFDDDTKKELGRGNQGVVYDATILPNSEVRFPLHLNSRDHYAVKLQTVEQDEIRDRKHEVRMALLVAQIQRPMPNVTQTLFWMRILTSHSTREHYTTIMPLVKGGTLFTVLRDDAYITSLKPTPSAFHLMLSTCILQVFAGICQVQAGGIKDFVHGDLHPDNVLREVVAAPACLMFNLGNGDSAFAPTWTCNNSVLRITDLGVASGTFTDSDGDHVVKRHRWTREDNEKLCQRVLLPFKSYLLQIAKEIKENLETLEPILEQARPEKPEDTTALIAEQTLLSSLKSKLKVCIQKLEYDNVADSLFIYGDRTSGCVFRQTHKFTTEKTDWLLDIPGTIKKDKLQFLKHTESKHTPDVNAVLVMFEQVAFLHKETGRSMLDLLRNDPLFAALRIGTTDPALVKNAALLYYAGTEQVEFPDMIDLAPAVPATLSHINSRLCV